MILDTNCANHEFMDMADMLKNDGQMAKADTRPLLRCT